jgi:hypothetical protein
LENVSWGTIQLECLEKELKITCQAKGGWFLMNTSVSARTLQDGRMFEIVKNLYDVTDLSSRCACAGFDLLVCQTPTHFLYGSGTRRR